MLKAYLSGHCLDVAYVTNDQHTFDPESHYWIVIITTIADMLTNWSYITDCLSLLFSTIDWYVSPWQPATLHFQRQLLFKSLYFKVLSFYSFAGLF